MDIHQAIRERRSARRYRPDPVPAEKLDTVLDAMRLASSARNAQPCRFIVVRDAGLKEKWWKHAMGNGLWEKLQWLN